MSDIEPNDAPAGDLDEQGEDLDERGLTPEPSPANPVSEDAGMA